MKRNLFLGMMGGPKAGKTHTLATMFESEYLDPELVLHLDNHGSTDAFDLHQYTVAEPWGVRHVPAPKDVLKALGDVKRRRVPYMALALDDWSKFSQEDVDERMETATEAQKIKAWGAHGSYMRDALRICMGLLPTTHVLIAFEAAQMPDPLAAKPKKVVDGELKYTTDTRDTVLRPFLQGAFARELPYKLDALYYSWSRIKKGGGYEFFLQMAPSAKVDVLTRWLAPWVEDPKRDKNMQDPTFDKLVEFIKTQTKEEV